MNFNPIAALQRLFAPRNATLAKPTPELLEAFGVWASKAGVSVTPESAMGVATVFACVNAGSRAMASLPLELYRRKPDGGREVETDGPQAALHTLLHDQPNPETTSVTFWRAIGANLVLRNQAFAIIVTNGLGTPVELWQVQNCHVDVRRDAAGTALYYVIQNKRYEMSEVLHFKNLTFDGLTGFDPTTTARDSIGLAIALQDYAATYFPNSVSPSAVIEFPKEMTKGQAQSFADEFDRVNTGNKNAHRRMFLWGGAKYNQRTNQNNQAAQFNESRDAQDKAICQILGIPLSKAGIMTEAHYNNAESENIGFVRDFLLPMCRGIEQELKSKLLPGLAGRRYYPEFNLDGLLRGDTAARAAFYEKMLGMSATTPNEIRRAENFNPVKGGELRFISQNLLPLDESGKPMQKEVTATVNPAPTSAQ